MRFICLALVLFSPAAAQAGWFSYDCYEDCMLGRMKGQTQMMFSAADKACAKEFKKEQYIGRGDVKWKFAEGESGGLLIFRIESGPEEYIITKGEFLFSQTCETLKEANSNTETIAFSSGKGLTTNSAEKNCARAINFYGIYK